MAELFLIGQIREAEGFIEPNLFVKYSIQTTSFWNPIAGETEGQTHLNQHRIEPKSFFGTPLDVHYQCMSIQGWPKLHIEVCGVDSLNKVHSLGFGFASIPTKPGAHSLAIPTWKLAPDTTWDAIKDKFGSSDLVVSKNDLIYSGLERYKINTKSSGTVTVDLMIITKNFSKFGVEL